MYQEDVVVGKDAIWRGVSAKMVCPSRKQDTFVQSLALEPDLRSSVERRREERF